MGFVRAIPVAFENRGTAHQDFAIFGNADFQIRHHLADGADAMIHGRVERDDGRGFGEAIAFVNADAGGGVPFGEFAAQRSASGDEGFDLAAHAFANFGEHELVGEFPGAAMSGVRPARISGLCLRPTESAQLKMARLGNPLAFCSACA